ncbi:hypothetical protein K5V21_12780 [Clostridium sardiniense]|uniref:Uncharacterized protein n=1 Tax=Clostridium sardiniense TaxID=29369 RepID=A0ABS7KZT4_CLOSR|nr:hypothetical protein [Clostridium sardiniense]MBM7833451.1 glucan phosphoethanolaminetransferase (alkaline phosphatase superfamily) [Clostridium sardiniense]MBY0756323.1 hypothetical protein [Clostridium sardiniense]MDQ0461480.1 glucan phosphoethanolaminetransferase (alkaline phosphatase superfamily) [Clostridium sardiniense]
MPRKSLILTILSFGVFIVTLVLLAWCVGYKKQYNLMESLNVPLVMSAFAFIINFRNYRKFGKEQDKARAKIKVRN